MSRRDIYNNITTELKKINGYNDPKIINKFADVTKDWTSAYNIGFSQDGFVQALSIKSEQTKSEYPMALKIIKISKAEFQVSNSETLKLADPIETLNLGNINKINDSNPTIPTNVWREIYCLNKMSPQNSKCENFAHFYGFFVCHWSDFMQTEFIDFDKADKNKSIKAYLNDREHEKKCILVLTELFDDHLLDWTYIEHPKKDWFGIWNQIMVILDNLEKNDIIHNDAHAKNFLIRYSKNLVVLIDFGMAYSRDFDLTPSERLLYKKLYKTNRDLSVISRTFDNNYITMFQIRKLKQIETMDKIEKAMPGFVEMIRSHVTGGPAKVWLKLAEVVGYSYDEDFKALKLLDEKKRMPVELVPSVDKLKDEKSHNFEKYKF